MRPRSLHSHSFSLLLCLVLLIGGVLLTSARAQDQISALKIKVGDKAPDFALPSADGKTIKLSEFAGHNVLIDFYRGYW